MWTVSDQVCLGDLDEPVFCCTSEWPWCDEALHARQQSHHSTSQTAESSSKEGREEAGEGVPILQTRKHSETMMPELERVSHKKGQ